jgi:CHAT domain-containing protein
MNLTQQLLQVNRQVITGTLPNDALLVEFVRFVLFDFHAVPAHGEPLWKPARYIAFVLSGRNSDQVQLIDLGEADRIDGLIADYRSVLTGEQEEDTGAENNFFAQSLAVDAPASADKSKAEQKRDLLPNRDVPDEELASLSGKQLREAIFDPLLPHLQACHQLFLAPDGNLSRLPFEALPAEDGTRLIDHFRISYVSVGRDLLRFTAASNRQAQAPVVMADPDFDLTAPMIKSFAEVPDPDGRRSADLAKYSLAFRRLPGTRQEGELIAQALGVQGMFDGQAVVGSLKALRSPRILHLATHGFFLPDQQRDPNKEPSSNINSPVAIRGSGGIDSPDRLAWLMGQHLENPLLRSGLAFAGANTWNRGAAVPPEAEDGLLTAEDVSGMDLLGTELVVLSACETGLGAVQIGEGVFGLRRTFMLAGAKTLVMSLWKVPDKQTQELMEDFYQRLLAGQPRAEALRGAQLAIKEKYPHPRFWGAFICQGNPGPLCQPE